MQNGLFKMTRWQDASDILAVIPTCNSKNESCKVFNYDITEIAFKK